MEATRKAKRIPRASEIPRKTPMELMHECANNYNSKNEVLREAYKTIKTKLLMDVNKIKSEKPTPEDLEKFNTSRVCNAKNCKECLAFYLIHIELQWWENNKPEKKDFLNDNEFNPAIYMIYNICKKNIRKLEKIVDDSIKATTEHTKMMNNVRNHAFNLYTFPKLL